MNNLAGKSFRNVRTGQVINVIDSFENIAILEDRGKINVQSLMDQSQYVEHIDPNKFFNNPGTFNLFAEKIKQVNLDNFKDSGSPVRVNSTTNDGSEIPGLNESLIIGYEDPEAEKLEMMEKYKHLGFDENAIRRQQELLTGILEDDDPNQPVMKPYRPEGDVTVSPNQTAFEEPRHQRPQQQSPQTQRIDFEDPITQMFRGVKRTVPLNLELKVEHKIPRLDFIEMMEDSYEISIIDFIADEITNQLLNDPSILKNSIKSKINQMIKANNKKEVVKKEIPVKKEVTKKATSKKLESPVENVQDK